MPRHVIDKATARARLVARREPYWGAPLGVRGLYLGFRKATDGGTWIARFQEGREKRYFSIGRVEQLDYAGAVAAAEKWKATLDAGVDTKECETVADACRAYVADRRQEKGNGTADDAEGRFTRTVYGHSIGKVPLAKLRERNVKDWRAGLKMSDASSNRYLSALKAALNFAVSQRYVEAGKTIEWDSVKPRAVSKRRDLYLDRDQRRALLDAMEADAVPFFTALCLLPLRPQALAGLKVRDYNARTGMLSIHYDKAGAGRVIPVPDSAAALFRKQAKSKLPGAPLIAYVDGSHWHKERWKKPIKRAAALVGLTEETCAYTLRHSTITDLVTSGLDLLTVARIAGTSVMMIEKHYGHLQSATAKKALAALEL